VFGDGGEEWFREVTSDSQVSMALLRRRLVGSLPSPIIDRDEAVRLARSHHGVGPGQRLLGCRLGYLEAPAHCEQSLLSLYYELAFEQSSGMKPVVHRIRAHLLGVDRFVCDDFPSTMEVREWEIPHQSRHSVVD
jgi:hypothetical protein